MSNKLDGLEPDFGSKARLAVSLMAQDQELKSLGVVSIVVVETRRPLPTQMAYYSRGRMATNDVKAMFAAAGLWKLSDKEAQIKTTWTLNSKHIDGKAVDLCPTKDGKTLWWDAPDEVWRRMAEIAESVGLKAGYRWVKPQQDKPHFEV